MLFRKEGYEVKSYKFIITGRVQGVYYRKNVQANAKKEKFSGYVKNLDDGTVEAGVTCNVTELEKFIDILQKGSSSSVVEDIKQFESNEVVNEDFEIRY